MHGPLNVKFIMCIKAVETRRQIRPNNCMATKLDRTQPSIQWVPGLFPEFKKTGRCSEPFTFI